MDANKGNIFQIFDGFRQFIIPVYQRTYSWEKTHCQRLWDDIVSMQKLGKEGHFIGSIVNIAEQAMPTGVQKFIIIDGQQRITTLTLLLIALRDYALSNECDVINAEMITRMLLKNDFQKGSERYKMLLTQEDGEVLIKLIEKSLRDTEGKSRIIKNYQFFTDQIKKMELSPDKIYEAIGKLQIVNITLDRKSDDAQAIFESLNSTGMELSQSDLIRNYILMDLDTNTQTDIYENIWHPMELLFEYKAQKSDMDKFFRDYITMKIARIPNINNVYEEFKSYRNNTGFAHIQELCKDIYKFAKYYTDMYYCKSSNTTINSLYKEIESLKMEVAFPFLLYIHESHADKIIEETQFAYILKLCIHYVLRRSICEIPTNSLNKTFATMKKEIDKKDYLNSVKAYFILRDSYKEFPTDDTFIKFFTSKDIFNMRIRNYILEKLELYDNKGQINVENYTIEHILPQNPNLSEEWISDLGTDWQEIQKTYLHTIGNLTLTAYNSEMSDHSFISKLDMKGGFKESALRLNTFLLKQTTWNKELIIDRANELSEKALKIWEYPQLSDDELAPYIAKPDTVQQYTLDTYEHLNGVTQTLFENLNTRIINLSSGVNREFKKLYIAYKFDTNFVDIIPQAQRLKLSINMKFSDIVDPKGLCSDITGLGKWGNGDVGLNFDNSDQIDDVMDIISQAYSLQADE